MFGGTRVLAQEAMRRADQALDAVDKHQKECIENNKKAAEWRGEVKNILAEQNSDLSQIKSFVSRIFLSMLGGLIVALAFLVFYGVKGIHP